MAENKKNEIAAVESVEAVDDEVAVDEDAMAEDEETDIVELKRPLRDGRKEITLDFDRVTGYILIKCEKEAKKEDPSITVPAISQAYQARVAAVAAKMKYDEILELSGTDFTAVCIKTQVFLMGSR